MNNNPAAAQLTQCDSDFGSSILCRYARLDMLRRRENSANAALTLAAQLVERERCRRECANSDAGPDVHGQPGLEDIQYAIVIQLATTKAPSVKFSDPLSQVVAVAYSRLLGSGELVCPSQYDARQFPSD